MIGREGGDFCGCISSSEVRGGGAGRVVRGEDKSGVFFFGRAGNFSSGVEVGQERGGGLWGRRERGLRGRRGESFCVGGERVFWARQIEFGRRVVVVFVGGERCSRGGRVSCFERK